MFPAPLTSWRAQFERFERGYARLLEPYQSSVAYNDDLAHFFQDCWHLKDWIAGDPTAALGWDIEAEVKAHRVLLVVADLANASKHLECDWEREGARITSTNVTVHLNQAKGIDLHYVVTLRDGSTLSAQDLVREAFAAWQTLLRRIGLIT